MSNLVYPKNKEPFWISYIKQRIKKNKNFLGFLSGPTGSGKSWTTLSICEQVDPNFKIDQVVFNGLELMNLINYGNLKKGSAICFEEVGVGLSSKSWQSTTNKMLNFLIQTFRHRNWVMIMNSPYMDFLDASTRRLMHAEMQTLSINYKDKTVKLKPQLLQYNSRLQKFYYKRLRVIGNRGATPLGKWDVLKPSDKIIKQYEEKKKSFTAKLNKEIYTELNKVYDTSSSQLTEIQKEVLELLKQGKVIKEIAEIRDRSPKVITETVRRIKQKGFSINAIYEGNKVTRYDVQEAS